MMGEIIKRPGTKFIKMCSGDFTQLVQVEGRVYGVTLVKGVPQSVDDLTELVKGNNGNESL